jgi:Zn-finger nucleic acid-binding protein
MNLHCPDCRRPLGVEPYGNRRIWACPSGHGELVGLAVLRDTAPGPARQAWAAAVGQRVRLRPCPSCTQGMAEVEVPTSPEHTQVDVCTTCQLVWFDAGERSTFLGGAPPPHREVEPRVPPAPPRWRDGRGEYDGSSHLDDFLQLLHSLLS